MVSTTLIIQGPIVHRDFNTLPIIENHIENSSHLFDNIIISTWSNEQSTHKEYLHILALKYNLKIILNELPKINLKNKQQYNNFLHYYSTYSAIRSNSCQGDILYKIRSDLSINLNDVVNFFTNEEEFNFRNQIGALWAYKTKPFAICDWLHVGSNKNLSDLCNAQLKYWIYYFSLRGKSEGLWPERDSLLKYLFYKKIDDSKLFPALTYLDFFPNIPKDISRAWRLKQNGFNQNQIELQNTFFHMFTLLPEHIAQKASIRRFDNRPWQRSDLLFREQQVEIQNEGYNKFLTINLLLNYEFKILKVNYLRDSLILNYLSTKFKIGQLPFFGPILLFIGQELMTFQSKYNNLVKKFHSNSNKLFSDSRGI